MAAFFRRPAWVVTIVILAAVTVWSLSLYLMALQIGRPFPGFIYSASYIVSSFTPEDLTGWRAGLCPGDRILAVNGQDWRELPRLVQEAGIGTTLVYTIERGNQRLQVAVPTMEFTLHFLLRFIPTWLVFSFLCLTVGVYVYIRNPAGRRNRYLLAYFSLWATGMGISWATALTPQKWIMFLVWPWMVITTVAGWIFFWSFPSDAARREFLTSVHLTRTFVVLAAVGVLLVPTLFFLGLYLDRPDWWYVQYFIFTWGALVVFGVGSIFNKMFPPLQIALRSSAAPLLRQQAWVVSAGLFFGFGGFLMLYWAPGLVHFPPVGDYQWLAGLVSSIYPLSIAYAVLRYQLLDIRVVVRKGLVYSLLTAALTAIFLVLSLLCGYLVQAATGQQSPLVALLPALLIAFLFQPARARIQVFVDRAFFHHEYEVRQTLTDFGRGLSTLREKGEVTRLVLETVTRVLGAEKAALWLLDGEGSYRPTEPGTVGTCRNGALTRALVLERRARVRIPDDHSPPAEEIALLGATAAVPLLAGDKLLGILTLGDKQSGEWYAQEDLELLTMLADNAALALENARLHEERMSILRRQLAQVTAAQEEERRRVARELHDGVGPALASLNVRLHTARKVLAQAHHPAAAEIEELAELAKSNVQDIRRLIHDLRPAVLDELGLAPALRDYLARAAQEHQLDVEFTAAQDERLPAALETALFRIVQEALNNIVKHAQARHVQVSLRLEPAAVILCVADDGRGFDTRARPASTQLGLWSMRERTEQLGGRFDVESEPGQGTRLMVTIPREVQPDTRDGVSVAMLRGEG